MLDQPLPDDPPRPDEHVQHPVGDAGVERELREPERGERRQLGRLENDGVAAGERRADLPGRDVERKVPRDDGRDDTERLAERHVHPARDRDGLAVVLVDRPGIEVEDRRNHADLAARARDRLADVLRLDLRELLGVLLDERREPSEQASTVDRRDSTPAGKRLLCGRDGGVGLLAPRLLELGDWPFRGRVENAEAHRRSAR